VYVLDVATTRRVLAAVIIAGMVTVLAVGAVEIWQRRAVFPPRRRRLTSWSLGEILIAFLLIQLIPLLIFEILKWSRFFIWWYGENPTPENHELLARCSLWAYGLGLPCDIAAVVGWLAFRGCRPWQYGLTTWRLGQSVAAGALAWCMLTPAVFLINVAVIWFYVVVLKTEPERHPLQRMANEATGIEWILIAIIALVKAAVEEELIFRGLLLPWLEERWWAAPVAWCAALIIAALATRGWAPVIFAGVIGLPLLLVCIRSDFLPTSFLAIYGSSLLFAIAHSNVWPTPIPLFFLGCGLGYLMQRTRSLFAPMTLHALFNSVSTILMLTGLSDQW
jgi:membrane protease YdiL (CAAX protease family)